MSCLIIPLTGFNFLFEYGGRRVHSFYPAFGLLVSMYSLWSISLRGAASCSNASYLSAMCVISFPCFVGAEARVTPPELCLLHLPFICRLVVSAMQSTCTGGSSSDFPSRVGL